MIFNDDMNITDAYMIAYNKLIAIIERIDSHIPLSNETCCYPGTKASVAARCELIDDKHPDFVDEIYYKRNGKIFFRSKPKNKQKIEKLKGNI